MTSTTDALSGRRQGPRAVRVALIAAAVAGSGGGQPAAVGQCDVTRLRPVGPVPSDFHLGVAVALDGDVAIGSAVGNDVDLVLVYRYETGPGGWLLEQTIEPPPGAIDDFGASLGLSGERAIIGAQGNAAYIYGFDAATASWMLQATLEEAVQGPSAFGLPVAIDGDVALVGDKADSEAGQIAGAIHVYRFDHQASAWIHEAKLIGSDLSAGHRFPDAVALHGDVVIAGDVFDTDNGTNAGAAYVFRNDPVAGTWSEEAKLTASDGAAYAEFGRAVAVHADLAVVGTPSYPGLGSNEGRVYVYRFDPAGATWIEEASLGRPPVQNAGTVGFSVATNGNAVFSEGRLLDLYDRSILVGSYMDPVGGWSEMELIGSADAFPHSRVGFAQRVSVCGDRAVFGLPHDASACPSSCSNGPGSVAVLTGLLRTDCDGNGVADGCEILACPGLDADDDGVPDRCTSKLRRYIGPPGGSWLEPGNWDGGLVPGPGDDVLLAEAAVIDGPGAAAASVRIVCDGALTLAGQTLVAPIVTVRDGGALLGTGTIAGDVDNGGRLEPGLPIGGLTIDGALVQQPEGTIRLEVSGLAPGSGYDTIDVGGSFGAGGAFQVQLTGGYEPVEGELFDVITYGSRAGDFDVVVLPPVPASLEFVGAYLSDRLRLRVASLAPVAPCEQGVLADAPYIAAVDQGAAVISQTVHRYDPAACPGGPCLPWIVEAVLEPPAETFCFGSATAMSGEVILVADRCDPDTDGAVYVFRRDRDTGAWNEEATLTSFDFDDPDLFGVSLDVSGDRAIVGGWYTSSNGPPGAAWIFRYDGNDWQPEAVLQPSDGLDGDAFGGAVAIDGDVAVVGAFFHEFLLGAAYVFRFDHERSRWIQEAKLQPSDADLFEYFGYTVETDGGVVVAARKRSVGGHQLVEAHVFRSAGGAWIEEARADAPFEAMGPYLGVRAVALAGDTLLLASYDDSPLAGHTGVVNVFRRNGWSWPLVTELRAAAPGPDDWFGFSVVSDGAAALVTATPQFGDNPDAVHFFHGLAGADCNGNAVADACDIAAGTSPDADGDGVPDECRAVTGDLDGNGVVDTVDLCLLLAEWGSCPDPCPPACPPDLDANCTVGISDLLMLLASWG